MLAELENRLIGAWMREYYSLPLCKEEERIRHADRAARLEMLMARSASQHRRGPKIGPQPDDPEAVASQVLAVACEMFGISPDKLEGDERTDDEIARANLAKRWSTKAIHVAFGIHVAMAMLGIKKQSIYDRCMALNKTDPKLVESAESYGREHLAPLIKQKGQTA